jgi:hypothetical protein
MPLQLRAYFGLLPQSRPKLPDQSEDGTRNGEAGEQGRTIAMQRLSTPWISAVFLVPACAIVVGGAEHRYARPAEFRVNSDLVFFPISITDRACRAVLGLEPRDFAVVEEGVPPQVLTVSRRDIRDGHFALILYFLRAHLRQSPPARFSVNSFGMDAHPDDLCSANTEKRGGATFCGPRRLFSSAGI